MKSVEQIFAEPSPATVNYRTATRRNTLQNLMDTNGHNDATSRPEPVLKYTNNETGGTKLGWANGVFIPVLLNIWGVIMFLRLGWVVGQAGLIQSTFIVIGANIVTGITALSLCAICTNGEVKGGGVYFLISRALGPKFGGTIGLLFFCAQAIATSIYVIGFAEAVQDLMVSQGASYITGDATNDLRVVGSATAVCLLLIALIGIGWYAKTQIGLLVVLLVAMVSVFIGAFLPSVPDTDTNEAAGFVGFGVASDNLGSNYQGDESFFTVFAVFFPAVTGIMAGANLSGDLDDPSVAIPKGTLGAIVLTFISYISLLWFIGSVCVASTEDGVGGLLNNNLIMKDVSVLEWLVYVGVFAATLSSALASLVGAPRILQSVAGDELFPWKWFNFFSYGSPSSNEPIRGYFLTFGITIGCVLVADLNAIAPIITNFFMISYALTNYACFESDRTKTPNWRPSFTYYNPYLSLAGAVLCIVVMFLIDWIPALITVVVVAATMYYLHTLDVDTNWGEADQAFKYTKALDALQTLQRTEKAHVKTFRPQFLVLTGDPFQRLWLLKFVSMLSHVGGGVLIAGEVIQRKIKDTAPKQANGGELEDSVEEVEEVGYSLSTVGTTSFRNLFANGKQDPEGSNDTDAIEPLTAKQLGSDVRIVNHKRDITTQLLEHPEIWNGGSCKGAFYEGVVAESVYSGFLKMLQLSGLGKIRPNTVVLGFKSLSETTAEGEVADFEKIVRTALSAHLGLLVVRDEKQMFDMCLRDAYPKNFMQFPFKNNKLKIDETSTVTSNDRTEALRNKEFESILQAQPASDVQPKENVQISLSQSDYTPEFKERIRKYKMFDNEFIKKEESKLPSQIPSQTGTIDVWWLADDGGLTMLLPQLLQDNPIFRNHSLRVVAVTNKFQSAEETSRLKKTELRMVHLLNKFRIKATTVGVDLNLEDKLQAETLERFKSVMKMGIDELDSQEAIKTKYHLRIAEEMRKLSSNASVVFVILPLPETSLKVRLYTSWLDMYSYDMPPMIMARGNNENVLTFFC